MCKGGKRRLGLGQTLKGFWTRKKKVIFNNNFWSGVSKVYLPVNRSDLVGVLELPKSSELLVETFMVCFTVGHIWSIVTYLMQLGLAYLEIKFGHTNFNSSRGLA